MFNLPNFLLNSRQQTIIKLLFKYDLFIEFALNFFNFFISIRFDVPFVDSDVFLQISFDIIDTVGG